MKTHEHALVSLGYAAAVAFLAGSGLSDPWLYISAVVGGEIIDFVDHPLYHLVYNRNEPHVAKAREIYKKHGVKDTVRFLNEVEDDRKFKGLLLHNVYSISIVALLGLLASLFLSAPIYVFVFGGAFLLHQITDIFGDFLILGHFDNWLWVLSDNVLQKLGNLKPDLLYAIGMWGAFIQLSFFIISFRIGWQLNIFPRNVGLFGEILRMGATWFAYVPLLVLGAYHLSLLSLGSGAFHKYNLEINRPKNNIPEIGSLRFIWSLIARKVPLSKRNSEEALLRMQADQETWIVISASLIVLALTTLTFLRWDYDLVVVLTPIFIALLFGTLIHTTVGEFGGVLGVLTAWLLNLLLARAGLQPLWSVYRGYLVFAAAAGAWILGLLGGMLLKGQSRMSLVVFSLQLNAKRKGNNDDWIQYIIKSAYDSLNEGYRNAHAKLYASEPLKEFVSQKPTDLLITPYHGNPIFGEEYRHLEASDSYVPLLRELEYVMCSNRIGSMRPNSFLLLPVMPRYRLIGKPEEGDIYWNKGMYYWRSQARPLIFSSVAINPVQENDGTWLLAKTRGEVLDHIVTRKSTFHTDLFIYSPTDQQDEIVVSGITREYTSTKEYATLEAEFYAANVLEKFRQKILDNKKIEINTEASARLFYPRISFYDLELVKWAEHLAVLPSDQGGFPRRDLSFIQKSLNSLPVKNFLPSATADFRKRIILLGVQYTIAFIISALNLDPNFSQTLIKIFEVIVK